MDFVQAVRKQIDLCEKHSRYICGIFISDEEQREIALTVILNLLSEHGNICCSKNKYEPFVRWMNNNSVIQIISPNEYVRGRRCSGAIISNSLDKEVVNTLVMPFLIYYRDLKTACEDFAGTKDYIGNIKERILTVDIKPEDVD